MQNDGKQMEDMMTDTHYNSTTTLQRIRDARPCEDEWAKLLAHLGKAKADDEPLALATVLESNGFDHALWVLSCAMPDDRFARHYRAWIAEQVLCNFERERPSDMCVRDQIAMLRNDNVTDEERIEASDPACDAANIAANIAARSAAWSAACDAVNSAARSAVFSAAWSATEGAARGAVSGAVWNAAWRAAKNAQEQQLRKMLGIA